jgi:flagellar biogenesis protein FliO
MTAMTQAAVYGRLGGVVSAFFRSLKKQVGSVNGALRIEERLSLGPKKMLFLVDCDGHKFLVATGADTIVSMAEIRPEEKRRKAEKA